jgi:hypothetical protein
MRYNDEGTRRYPSICAQATIRLRKETTSNPMLPTRYVKLEEARNHFGSHVDRLGPFLLRADPLADEVAAAFARLPPGRGRKHLETALEEGIGTIQDAPPALKALFAQVDEVPLWVDWDQLDHGAATHRRCGLTGGLVLACCSLPLIYSSPAGNKPLIFSGRLVQRAARRLSETGRFALESTLPGGLRHGAPGWKVTIKVRLMHAQVRRLLLQSGRWDTSAWGVPINQVDMAITNLLFSVGLLDNLRRIGFHFAHAEGESVMHLWRYSGHLLGIEPELLCATEDEGRRLADLILRTQGPPDRDAQELTRALMEMAIPHLFYPASDRRGRTLTRFCYGLSHTLLGRELAEGLSYPRTWWRHLARLLARTLIGPVETCRRLVPGGRALAVAFGSWKIRRRMQRDVLAGKAAFPMPERLSEPAAPTPGAGTTQASDPVGVSSHE